MLKSKTNTPIIEAEVMAAASKSPDLGANHRNLETLFESGQWHVACSDCGAKWSAIDFPMHNIYGFEVKESGDGSCLRANDEDSCIAGMKCPKCGYTESFKIGISTIMEFDSEGETMGSDDSAREWNEKSYCECPHCSYYSTVGEFQGEPPAPKPQKKPVNPNDILEFVNLIARMTADGDPIDSSGELLQDGTEDDLHYEMQAEDAIMTMGELIATARKLQDRERPNMLLVSDRELNQVLAALRHWQHDLPHVAENERYSEYLEDGLTFLDADDIDILCERFNLGPIPDEEDAKFSHMKKVSDGYYCERHQKHSPGLNPYCRDCDRGE